ncbi:hypothetical protein SMMN14_09046 [Sphaerulina musiva]
MARSMPNTLAPGPQPGTVSSDAPKRTSEHLGDVENRRPRRGRTCVGRIDLEEAIGRKLMDASGAQEEPETLVEA